MNPNNFSPELFIPPMMSSSDHGGGGGYPQAQNDFLLMMRGHGSNSPMSYGPPPIGPPGGPSSGPPLPYNSNNNFGGGGNSFVNSSPIPTPMQQQQHQSQNYPSNNSASSSNRSSVYGFNPGSYSHPMGGFPPQHSSNPSSYPYKNNSGAMGGGMFGGPNTNNINNSMNSMASSRPTMPSSSSPLFMNQIQNQNQQNQQQNGPSPFSIRDLLPSDMLSSKTESEYHRLSTNDVNSASTRNNQSNDNKAAPSSSADSAASRQAFNKNSTPKREIPDSENPFYERISASDTPGNYSKSYHASDADFAEEVEKYAPKTVEENPSGEYTFENGRKVPHRLLSKLEAKRQPQASWQSLVLKGGICNLSSAIFDMKHIVNLFVSNNRLTTLPPGIKKMENLEILDLSNNQITSLPLTIGDLPKLKKLYLENNKLEDVPCEIGRLHNLEVIDLSENPLKPELASIYGDGGEAGKEAIMSHFLNRMVKSVSMPERPFIEMPSPKYELPSFTLMCYNILADIYATPQAHVQCPAWALHWKYRCTFLLREIQHYSPDLFALQELQDEQYCTVFKIHFEKLGYGSTFYPKTRSTGMAEKERRNVDGCALFWRIEKFEFECEETVNYNHIASSFGDSMKGNPATKEFLNRVMPKDNIALIVTLKPKVEALTTSSNPQTRVHQSITIANTHLHWDPEYSDVKIVQSMLLVRKLKEILSEKAIKLGVKREELPLIILGDFNSLPDSAVHEYLATNKVPRQHPEFKGFSNYDISFIAGGSDQFYYKNSLDLTSAFYPHKIPFTNFTTTFKGCIDHIFISKASLQTLKILGPIEDEWIRRNNFTGFPNECVPSDHIPIMGKFAIRSVDDKLAMWSSNKSSSQPNPSDNENGFNLKK